MKKTFIMSSLVILCCLAICFKVFWQKKIHYRSYDSYEISITIDINLKGEADSIMTNVKSDGKQAIISSPRVNKETYIIGNTLYYIEGVTIYNLSVQKSYLDLYNIIKEFTDVTKEREENNYTYYTSVLSSKQINDILDALYFGKKTNEKSVAKIAVLEGRIDEFTLPVVIEGYEEVNINFKFNSLESTYKIDTSKLYGTSHLGDGIKYKIKLSDENPYEVLE